MKSKVISGDGNNYLIARYDNFYNTNDYFFRTFMLHDGSYKLVEFELTIDEAEELRKKENFYEFLQNYKNTHDFTYEKLIANTVSSYIISEYESVSDGVKKIISNIIKYPIIAEEFYNGIIVRGEIPKDGIRIKGYTAYDIKKDNDVGDIQAYFVFADIIGDSKVETKQEHEQRKKETKSSKETMVLPSLGR